MSYGRVAEARAFCLPGFMLQLCNLTELLHRNLTLGALIAVRQALNRCGVAEHPSENLYAEDVRLYAPAPYHPHQPIDHPERLKEPSN